MFLSHLREDRITRGKAQCLLAVGVPLDMRQLAYPSRGYYSRYSLRLAFSVCRYYTVTALLRQLAYQEQSHNERGADVVGAFQLFHHSQYLRPHRRGQQDGSREHDCQQNQPWRTSRKKEISQAKNCLGEKLRWANLSAKTNGK